MTNGASPADRVLFVIDNDFGALGTVMYLLHRQPLSTHATLLLPRRAHELHKDGLQVACRPYQSLQDILDFVAMDPPDVAFLFSGYLFASQGLLTIGDLRKLVRELRQRDCRVATSDPYLGTFHRIADAIVPAKNGVILRGLDKRLLAHPRVHELVARFAQLLNRKRLQWHVRRVADILREATHIYPVPMDLPEAGGVRRVSFFNPLYIRSQEELRRNSAAVSARPGMAARGPRWLFVLAQFDLELQEKRHGKPGFVDMVAGKIREALESGRHPTFVGPAAFVEALARHFTPDSGVSLLSCCPFEEFERRLLDAEMVFYWQIFSTSAFLRLWNGMPVFYFDEGHNAHLLEAMREAGLRHYFLAGSPIRLDIANPLDAVKLTEMSAGFRQAAHESRLRLAGLATPAELLVAIKGDG
jgi:hypothetical protein